MKNRFLSCLFLCFGFSCDSAERDGADDAAAADHADGGAPGSEDLPLDDAATPADGGAMRDASVRDASAAGAAASDASTRDASPGGADAGPVTDAVPSAGCGKGGRLTNGVVSVANDHIYNFPSGYDGSKPFPLLMALHANANPITQLQGLTNATRLEANFIRVFPKSAGQGWVMVTDAARITAIYNDVITNHCVDTSRVFLTGHSSGAQMAVQMLCASGGEKRFKAVAPVAASKYCAKVVPIPVMYIQGMMDAMRGNGNGSDLVNVFSASNGCTTETVPDPDVQSCKSSFDKADVTPGCVSYQGCSQPTIWCSHNDSSYNASDGRQHGWPCFASNAMADFFLGLP